MRDRETPQDLANRDVIAALVEETHQPYEVVEGVYKEQFARFSADARISDYVSLFASRRTREILTHKRS